MKDDFIDKNIEQILIRLIVLEWYLDGLSEKDIKNVKKLIKFLKDEVNDYLKILDKFYFGKKVTVKSVTRSPKKAPTKKPSIKRKRSR